MTHSLLFRRFSRIFRQAHHANLSQNSSSKGLTKRFSEEHKLQGRLLENHLGNSSGLTRRRLIKTTTLAASSALTVGAFGAFKQALSNSNPRIAIVGGGLAGLNAAWHLKQAGLAATVYEAKKRLGGRIQSNTGGIGSGLVIEVGGAFINQNHADLLALVKTFNLTLFNRLDDADKFSFPEVGYFFDGKVRTEAEVAQNMRPLAKQIAKDAGLIDINFDRFAPELDQLSVTQYLNRHRDKILDPFIRTLIENSIRTEYGVEPDESSALQLLFNLPTVSEQTAEVLGNSDETFVVAGGAEQIITGLAQALSGQIQTNRRLIKIQSQGSGFQLTFEPNQVVEADYVILAIPFTVLRSVELRVTLPPLLRRFINEVDLGQNEKVFAGFEQKVWRRPQGFVNECWTDLGFSEVWDATQPQTERTDGALTFFLGGNEVKAADAGGAPFQGRQFLKRFEAFIPGISRASTDRFLQTRWTRDPLVRGGYTTFKPGQLTTFGGFLYVESDEPGDRQDVNVGNLFLAGEQVSDEFYGFMNGSAQTGRLAAEGILRRVSR